MVLPLLNGVGCPEKKGITTGTHNTAIGNASSVVTTGTHNTAIGYDTGITTGDHNVAIG